MADIIEKDLESLESAGLQLLVQKFELEADIETELNDAEVTRSIIYSFLLSTERRITLSKELAHTFPALGDIVPFLLESTGDEITADLADQIIENNCFVVLLNVNAFEKYHEIVAPTRTKMGTIFLIVERVKRGGDVKEKVRMSRFICGQSWGICAVTLMTFGYHQWCLTYEANLTSFPTSEVTHYGSIFVTSPIYEFILHTYDVHDLLVWGWGFGGIYTEELENCLLELLIGVNDEMESTIKSWQPMMAMLGAMGDESTMLHQMIKDDISKALAEKSMYAIGRLHMNLAQLLDNSSNFMALPESFNRSIKAFILEKIKASSIPELLKVVCSTMVSLEEYLVCNNISEVERTRLLKVLGTLKQLDFNTSANVTHGISPATVPQIDYEIIAAIHNLRPRGMEMLMCSQSNSSLLQSASEPPAIFMPVVDTSEVLNSALLCQLVNIYSQSLHADVIQIQSMIGYQLGLDIQQDIKILTSLLDAGLEYVVSGSGKLLAMMHVKRAVLILNRTLLHSFTLPFNNFGISRRLVPSAPLTASVDVAQYHQQSMLISTSGIPNDHSVRKGKRTTGAVTKKTNNVENECLPMFGTMLPPPLQKRRKELPRIFRTKISPSDKLTLKVNSDFDEALSKLRQQHGDDCWVNSQLELVWKSMFHSSPPQLLIFELWFNDKLIAADFGHPCGCNKSFYVATRYHSHGETKQLQPGFLLALLECSVLQKYDCVLWDLGGVDRCPLMQYKLNLTGEPLERPVALSLFQIAKGTTTTNTTYTDVNKHSVAESCPGSTKSLRDLVCGTIIENVSVNDLLE